MNTMSGRAMEMSLINGPEYFKKQAERLQTCVDEMVYWQLARCVMEDFHLDTLRHPWSSTFEDSILTSPLLPIAAFVMSFLLFLWVVL